MLEKDNATILNEILGSKTNEVLRLSNDIYRYLWEQVFAVCIYSREMYLSDKRPLDFHNRIRLAHCLTQLNKKVAEQKMLLNMLNENVSSSDIVDKLRNMKLERIIHEMEELNIAFPKTDSKYHYTYWQMYHSLANPIAMFKTLLKININDELLASISNAYFKKKLKFAMLSEPVNDALKIKSLSDIYHTNKEMMLAEKDKLFEHLNFYILNLFQSKSKELLCSSLHNGKSDFFFDKYVEVTRNNKSIDIKIDKNFLDSFINIGQYDSFTKALQEKILLDKTNENSETIFQENKINKSFEDKAREISQWQKKNSIGLVKRIDQCPRIIASIINFDLKKRIGLFDKKICPDISYYINTDGHKNRNEVVKGITSIIRFFLYYDYQPEDEYIIGDRCFLVDFSSDNEKISRENLELDKEKILPCKIMEDWCNRELKKTTELFKKTPKIASYNVSEKISEQIKNSREDTKTAFPLCVEIPMPFWVKF